MVGAAAAALVIGLTGCSLLDPDSPAPSPTAAGPTGGAHPSGRPTIPPQLLECGQDTPKKADPAAGDQDQVDLTDAPVAGTAAWDVPAGFEESWQYRDDQDYEQRMFMHTYVPTAPGYDTLDLLGVLGYEGLDWGDLARECGQVPLSAMLERVSDYREMLGAQPLAEAELTEVAGLPAVTQELRIAAYDFRGYWLFSQTQLFYITCQWTSDTARQHIEAACTDLVGSVRVG